MKVLIAAGGTGGHIFPGIAIAQEWQRRFPETGFMFVGTERGLESKLVPKAGFPLTLIQAGALNNVSLTRKVSSLLKMPVGVWQAMRLLRSFRPDIVVGIGGYASGVMVLVAALQGFPTMVVEPNALPGFTNRKLARFVNAAGVTFAEAARFFPGKAVLTGTPVRADFEAVQPKSRTEERHLLIFGGSQGARAINQAMIAAAPILAKAPFPLRITHQTGEADFETVRQGYAATTLQVEVRPFIYEMAAAFAAADLLICRAGAMTAAEVAAAGKAAIFIPFPLAADDHQRKNAEAFVRAGAGRLVVQAELTGERLAQEILTVLENAGQLSAMEQAGRRLARSNAAGHVVDLALRVARRASFSELLVKESAT
ncbi:MAG: undecaprenyldiphospho-muramoylpentapeptide beta-N-acetylglucosaminyltransferase [Blastocatellia bacterium]|nr:undecaprenyldiphospho-muramoylpentapeptide beta-N-acetylglucosaminyltransferase [Blastocatellia bacterium]